MMIRICRIIDIRWSVTILLLTFCLFISLYNLWKDLSNIRNTSNISQWNNNTSLAHANDKTEQKGVKKHGNDNITILFWNFFWEIDRMGEGNSGFVKNKCKYTNCFTSNDRADLYRTDKRVDAVIVHGLLSPDFKNEFKNFKLENVKFFDFIRMHNEGILPHFVYFNREPPENIHDIVYESNQEYYDVFDITYTYRKDAVITSAYGKVIPITESTDDNALLQDKSIPAWKTFNSNLVPKSILERNLANKTKGILWMVSHCKTDSRREDYVKKLQTHLKTLSIDILGKCGNNSVIPSQAFVEINGKIKETLEENVNRREEVYKRKLPNYKFYLSFENSKCEDYISEKFFNVLRSSEAIPVVLGGKTSKDYSKVAPPHSYIHVNDFSTIKDLAAELEYLNNNETAYNEYFWWTEHYKVSGVWDNLRSSQCDLCEKLNLARQGKINFPKKGLFDDLKDVFTCNFNTTYV